MKTMQQIEFEAIAEALRLCGHNRADAARMLDIGERSLYRKISSSAFKDYFSVDSERPKSSWERLDELDKRVTQLEKGGGA